MSDKDRVQTVDSRSRFSKKTRGVISGFVSAILGVGAILGVLLIMGMPPILALSFSCFAMSIVALWFTEW